MPAGETIPDPPPNLGSPQLARQRTDRGWTVTARKLAETELKVSPILAPRSSGRAEASRISSLRKPGSGRRKGAKQREGSTESPSNARLSEFEVGNWVDEGLEEGSMHEKEMEVDQAGPARSSHSLRRSRAMAADAATGTGELPVEQVLAVRAAQAEQRKEPEVFIDPTEQRKEPEVFIDPTEQRSQLYPTPTEPHNELGALAKPSSLADVAAEIEADLRETIDGDVGDEDPPPVSEVPAEGPNIVVETEPTWNEYIPLPLPVGLRTLPQGQSPPFLREREMPDQCARYLPSENPAEGSGRFPAAGSGPPAGTVSATGP
eukprot:Hpha_TRINITY_DN16192_c0_g2::TRINITY_DN16192_c0_g2_i1::g.7695::m.7695